jgi:mannose-6-phosphate isomerase-like protein (cupin superfamily)
MNKIEPAFAWARSLLNDASLKIASEDLSRPWGGFFVIDEKQSADFIHRYFPDEEISLVSRHLRISPKLLIVAPGKRLSWQYHHRRSEIWHCIGGNVGVITSHDDREGAMKILDTGDRIQLDQGERHRLVGLDDWGIVAEIWIHTDPENPSNEEDIIRLQDDFDR